MELVFGQFVHPLGEEGIEEKGWNGEIVILAAANIMDIHCPDSIPALLTCIFIKTLLSLKSTF